MAWRCGVPCSSRKHEKSNRLAPVEEFFAHAGSAMIFYRALIDSGRIHAFFDLAEGCFARGIARRLRQIGPPTPLSPDRSPRIPRRQIRGAQSSRQKKLQPASYNQSLVHLKPVNLTPAPTRSPETCCLFSNGGSIMAQRNRPGQWTSYSTALRGRVYRKTPSSKTRYS